jgi:hypothetical protein
MYKKLKNRLAFLGYAFLYQVVQTVFFLVRDGWHWKAASTEEAVCDGLYLIVSMFGVYRFLWVCIDIVEAKAIAVDDRQESEASIRKAIEWQNKQILEERTNLGSQGPKN